MTRFFPLVFAVLLGCSSQPVLPTADDIKVSRDEPDSECEFLGAVEGRVMTHQGTAEDALKDMKSDAAKKGANYVRIETQSGNGTAVRGRAYLCR